MAAIMVLVSGWVGLAVAILGQIFTDATFGQFFLTWMQVGLTAFFAVGLLTALRRGPGFRPAQEA